MAKQKKETVLEKRYHVKLCLTEMMLGSAPSDKDIYSKYIASKNGDDNLDELGTLPEATERGMTVFHRFPDGTPAIYEYHIYGFFKDTCSMLRRNAGRHSAEITAFRKIIDGQLFVEPRLIRLELPEYVEEPIVVVRPNPNYVELTEAEQITLGYGMAQEKDGFPDMSDAEVIAYYSLRAKAECPKTVKKKLGTVKMPAKIGVLERPLRGQTPQGERVALAKSETVPAGTRLEFDVIVQDVEAVTTEVLEEWFSYGQRRGLGQWRNGGWGAFTYELTEILP